MSPFHFHRLFKSVTGMTPKAATSVAVAAPAGSAGAGDTGDPRRAGGWFSRQQQLLSPCRRSVRDDRQPVSPRRRHRGNSTTGDCALGRCRWRRASAASARCCRVITMRHCSTTCAGAFPMPSCVKATPILSADGRDFRPPRRQPAAGIAAAGSAGTAFQLQVWQALRQIPVGETRSYRRGRAYWPAAGGGRLRGEFAGDDCSLPPGGA